MVADLVFQVYVPAHIGVVLEDATLHRFGDADGQALPSSCGSQWPYQRTRAHASVDGLDATSLVQLAITDTSVASIGSGELWNVVTGRAPGMASVFLSGRPAGPQASLRVVDSEVTVLSLRARLVTSVSWTTRPASTYAFAASSVAGVVLSQELNAEGDRGSLVVQVTYSDAATQDIEPDEIDVMTVNSNVEVIPPMLSSRGVWELGVAVGSQKGCPADVFVNWTVCGRLAAT
eukprot:7383877-Prymnesium_polylepis.1